MSKWTWILRKDKKKYPLRTGGKFSESDFFSEGNLGNNAVCCTLGSRLRRAARDASPVTRSPRRSLRASTCERKKILPESHLKAYFPSTLDCPSLPGDNVRRSVFARSAGGLGRPSPSDRSGNRSGGRAGAHRAVRRIPFRAGRDNLYGFNSFREADDQESTQMKRVRGRIPKWRHPFCFPSLRFRRVYK